MIRKLQLVALFLTVNFISFGQQTDGGKNIVVHTVEKGETVYSIAKLYLLKPDDIQGQNPSIDSTYAIKPGQILRIEIPDDLANQEALSELQKSPIHHVVEDEETLYSISKTYGVSINDLQDWNEIEGTNIGLGQQIIVGWKYSNNPTATKPIKPAKAKGVPSVEEDSPPTPAAQASRSKPESYFSNNKQEILQQRFVSDNGTKDAKSQEGVAIWFTTDNKMMSSSYYGLFSDVPVGSIIKVTNLMNNRVVFVKVIGNLPDTAENHGALIKLTPAAKKLLQTSDGKIRVRINYAK